MAISYKDSGVDVERGYEAVRLMREHVKSTYTEGVLGDIGSFGGGEGSGSDVQGDVVTVKVAEDTPAGTYKLKLSGYGGITRMFFTFTVNGVDYKTAIDMVGGMGVSVTVELKGGDEFTITSNNIEDAPNLKLTMTAV